jgi:xylose isomerase
MAKIRNNDGSVTTFHDQDDGGIVIAKEQNVSALIDANKEEYNTADSKWNDNALENRVARIPMAVFEDLQKQGITRGFTVIDMPRFKAWLNNPDNRVFRTKAGRI